jgi:hypothetical protein
VTGTVVVVVGAVLVVVRLAPLELPPPEQDASINARISVTIDASDNARAARAPFVEHQPLEMMGATVRDRSTAALSDS